MVKNPSTKAKTESVDEVILRLLGLKPGVEIDYQTYHDIIKKKLALGRLAGKELPREEDELLRNEFKRVRTLQDKGIRFKVKKTRVKKSKGTTNQNLNLKQLPAGGSAIVKYKKQAIVPNDLIPKKVEEEPEKSKKEKDNFSPLKKTLDSILKTLGSKFKFDQKQEDQNRREKETERRNKREIGLEGLKKGISGVVALTKKMLSPFDSVLQRIWRFIFFTLLGRAFTKFMDWMSDKENKRKFDSFIEFLSDHWPALAGLYILFGTGFGKLVRGLLKGTARMIVALAMSIPKLIGFIKKNKKLAFLALAAAPLVTREVSNLFKDKESSESTLIPKANPELNDAKKSVEKSKDSKVQIFNNGGIVPQVKSQDTLNIQPKSEDQKVQGLNIGGIVPQVKSNQNIFNTQTNQKVQGLNIGGIVPQVKSNQNIFNTQTNQKVQGLNIGGLIGKFAIGGISPSNKMNFQSGIPITGAGKDDTLIAAKTGEAILTEKDQIDLSLKYIDRNTGQPLNISQYLSGRKPGYVSVNNIKFPGLSGGFFDGGVVEKFNQGGIVGGGGMVGPSWLPWNWGKFVDIHRSSKPEDYTNQQGFGSNLARRRQMMKELGYQSGGPILPMQSSSSPILKVEELVRSSQTIGGYDNQQSLGSNLVRRPMTKKLRYQSGGSILPMQSGDSASLRGEDIARLAQAMTVRIEGGGPSGSGVIVRNDKGNYTVLTAGHVLQSAPEEGYSIITPDGKRYNVPTSNSQRLGKDVDMGMLKFSSKENYQVATPGDLGKLGEKDKIFVGGFPLPTETMPQSLMRLTSGNRVSTDKNTLRSGYDLTYNNPTLPGMSGGPVFNSRGELIGIHGRKAENENTPQTEIGSMAMPISHYTSMFGDQSFGSTETDRPITRTPILSSIMSPNLMRREDLEVGRDRGIDGGLNAVLSGLGANIYNQKNSYVLGSPTEMRQFNTINKQSGGLIENYNKGGMIENVRNFITKLLSGSSARATQTRRSQLPIPDFQTPEGSALLRTIRSAEHYKGANPYTSIYGGGNVPITQMTVQEVIQMANTGRLPTRFGGKSAGYGSGSAATGAYQFMPFTLQDLIRKGSVKPDQIMSPELQDRLGWELVRGRGVNLQSLRKSGLTQEIMDKIAPEWASFPYSPMGGSSYYGQPVKGADFLRKIYQRSLVKKQGGGSINGISKFLNIGKVDESEGLDKPGSNADRRLFPILGGGAAALQPGEYVLPVDTVNHLGLPFIEKLVASTDSNSDAYLKKGKINRPEIAPYSTQRSSIASMTLPPMDLSSSNPKARSSGYGGGSSIPSFSAISPINDRDKNAKMYYGIV